MTAQQATDLLQGIAIVIIWVVLLSHMHLHR